MTKNCTGYSIYQPYSSLRSLSSLIVSSGMIIVPCFRLIIDSKLQDEREVEKEEISQTQTQT